MNRLIAVILALLALVPAYASQTEPIFVNSTKDEAGWLDFKKRFLDGPDGKSLYVDGKFPAAVLGPAACQVAVNQKRLTQDKLADCSEAFRKENGVDSDIMLTREAFRTRGQGARYYMPSMVLAQAPAAPPGAAANGTGAMPVPAAAPAAPAPDSAAQAEMKRQLVIINAAKAEAAAAVASTNALSGRIDGVGQQASAAARAASAVQETARRLGGRVEVAEKVANAASGVAGEAKAEARGAAASAAGATADAALARTDAASAVGLAFDTSKKVEGFEVVLKNLQLTVKQLDWRPLAGVAALALLTALGFWFYGGQMKDLKTVATKAEKNAADALTQVAAVASTVAGHTSDIVELKADVRGVRDMVEGQPGYTEFPGGKEAFEARLAMLGVGTNPTLRFEVLVTSDEGMKFPFNLNITAAGDDRYLVQGIRDQGDKNSLKRETLYQRIQSAGKNGRIVGCEPYVPPADSPSNGPKTVQQVARLPPAAQFPRRAGRTQFVATPPSDPDLVSVPAFLRAPRGDVGAVTAVAAPTDLLPDFPLSAPAAVPAEQLPGLAAVAPSPPPVFDTDVLMAQPLPAPAAAVDVSTATGAAGS